MNKNLITHEYTQLPQEISLQSLLSIELGLAFTLIIISIISYIIIHLKEKGKE